MERVACIDIGTVTVRLAVADVEDSHVVRIMKRSTICNLGEGLSATGMIGEEARGRVVGCVDAYLQMARGADAHRICCTLTSAARDASNSQLLLDDLTKRGIHPQIIAGEVEGSLTFLGVAQDFVGRRILVADNGGGSTELAVGSLDGGHGLRIDGVHSTDVGCRRITERFLSKSEIPSQADLAAARDFARELFQPVIQREGILREESRPERLVVTGGTATSLVAMHKELEPYDSSQVHLASLSRAQVEDLTAKLASLTVAERAELPGLQAKRAPVILAGALAIAELMAQTHFDELTVSESDLLFGLSICAGRTVRGEGLPFDWKVQLSDI